MTQFNIITDPATVAALQSEQYIAGAVGAALTKHYPGRQWLVQVSVEAGTIDIACPSISAQFGYMIHLNQPIMVLQKKAVMAGGEILERFGLSRHWKADDDIEGLKRNRLGITEGLKHGGV